MLLRLLRVLRDEIAMSMSPVAYHRARGVRIGEHVELIAASRHTFGSEPYLVRIGDRVTISDGVRFVTHDGGLRVIRAEHPGAFYYAPIEVGEGAFLGTEALLLPGVTIGEGAVIGARAVVTTDVPARTVAAGVPARAIRPVADYAFARAAEWVDTSGMTEAEKERALRRHFGRARAPR